MPLKHLTKALPGMTCMMLLHPLCTLACVAFMMLALINALPLVARLLPGHVSMALACVTIVLQSHLTMALPCVTIMRLLHLTKTLAGVLSLLLMMLIALVRQTSHGNDAFTLLLHFYMTLA